MDVDTALKTQKREPSDLQNRLQDQLHTTGCQGKHLDPGVYKTVRHLVTLNSASRSSLGVRRFLLPVCFPFAAGVAAGCPSAPSVSSASATGCCLGTAAASVAIR